MVKFISLTPTATSQIAAELVISETTVKGHARK
jgi:DNA-binding NarL/FixJ family response regulator